MIRRRLAIVALAAAAIAVPGQAQRAGSTFEDLAAAYNRHGGLIRIGLEPARRITLGGSGPFRILDPDSPRAIWKPSFRGEVTVVAEGGPEEDPGVVYRIQVSAFSNAGAAEAERARLEAGFSEPAVVRYVPDRGSWRVRIGSASERGALAPLLERLRAAGHEGLWIAEEPAAEVSGVTLRIVDATWNSVATGRTRLAVVPESGSRLEVDGKSYRGIVELRIDAAGRVRPINWVEMESYLLGVVPSELGPEVWPQLEALKAQAVAARTYAVANLGQFGEEGFDICATPRCQVYGGASAEHPMSDRAVLSTRGEIVSYEGKPITALYTATCGGHTESAAEIFPEQAAPYLVGVPCRSEDSGRAPAVVTGRAMEPLAAESGEDVTRDAALLIAAGIASAALDARAWALPPEPGEIRSWTTTLARLAGRPAPSGEAGGVSTLAAAAAAITRDLGLEERARILLDGADLPALLRDPDTSTLPEDQRRALAYLASTSALRPLADGRLGARDRPSRARLAPLLARAGESYEALGLREASVVGLKGRTLRLFQGRGEIALPLTERPFLFSLVGGRPVPVGQLDLWPGDRVRVRAGRGGGVDFLEVRPPVKGTADDRTASLYSWEIRKSREALEESINRRVAVGRVRDLVVRRRGVSGRIVELEIVGSKGSTLARGFDIRGLLDLRETLTVVEIQRNASGGIDSVVFAGKGWGHGVGLCQVGAYGMALRGETYKAILAHYYPGTRVERAFP